MLTDLRDTAFTEISLLDVAPEPTYMNLAKYLGARYQKVYEAGEADLIKKLARVYQVWHPDRYLTFFSLALNASLFVHLRPMCLLFTSFI